MSGQDGIEGVDYIRITPSPEMRAAVLAAAGIEDLLEAGGTDDQDPGDTVPCPTCDGTGTSTYRGESHRTYDEPDYTGACAICGGSGELPASMFTDSE
jgi:hypothetical protein